MTALTCFFTAQAASTVTTANLIYTTSGSPSLTNKNSLVNQVTGWGEFYSQGNASAWAGAGSAPSPSGHGWLLDSTVLEGQQFAAANWSGTMTLKMDNAVLTTSFSHIELRAYKRSSGGVYTNIVTIDAGSGSVSNTTTITFSATAGSATSFSTGDKLYIDLIGDISTAPTFSGHSIEVFDLSTDTSGLTGSTASEMVTPGYTSSGGGGTTHFFICDGFGGCFS